MGRRGDEGGGGGGGGTVEVEGGGGGGGGGGVLSELLSLELLRKAGEGGFIYFPYKCLKLPFRL